MDTSSHTATWLIPVALLAFPVVFVGMWCLVCALLAAVSGYRSLAAFRVDDVAAAEGEALPTPWYAMVGVVSYRGGILSLRAGSGGLTVQVSRLFPFHPPIRVPWQRVEVAEGGRAWFGRAMCVVLLDGRVRLRLPAETAAELARLARPWVAGA